jgi:hypothetical protein
MDKLDPDGMYQFDTMVFMAIDLSFVGKTHLVYRQFQGKGIAPLTLCGRKAYGSKVRSLPKVDVLGAITTTPCLQCLRMALTDTPNSIKEIGK